MEHRLEKVYAFGLAPSGTVGCLLGASGDSTKAFPFEVVTKSEHSITPLKVFHPMIPMGYTNPRLIASTLISRLPRFCDIVVRLVAAGDGTLPRLSRRKHVQYSLVRAFGV